jgi:transcriptional regulator with XRE-family HTH domain
MKYDISVSLSRIREERNLTRNELAIMLGFSSTHTCKLLTGISHIGVKAAENIALTLRIPIETLLGFTPEEKPKEKAEEYSGDTGLEIKYDPKRIAETLRMLKENGNGLPYFENTERAYHDPDAAPVKGVRRRGCNYITEATAAGGGQG